MATAPDPVEADTAPRPEAHRAVQTIQAGMSFITDFFKRRKASSGSGTPSQAGTQSSDAKYDRLTDDSYLPNYLGAYVSAGVEGSWNTASALPMSLVSTGAAAIRQGAQVELLDESHRLLCPDGAERLRDGQKTVNFTVFAPTRPPRGSMTCQDISPAPWWPMRFSRRPDAAGPGRTASAQSDL